MLGQRSQVCLLHILRIPFDEKDSWLLLLGPGAHGHHRVAASKVQHGNILHVNNIDKLCSLCEELVDKNISPSNIDMFKDKYISNVGKSAEYAANYLIKKS